MTDRGSKFSFFQGIHVRIDVRTDITSSRPMTTTKIISPLPESLWSTDLAG